MIKCTDLRIGNIVSNGDPVILKFYMLNSMLDGDYVDYDPIDLDEEWCRKFGFVNDSVKNEDGDDVYFWKIKKPNKENLYLDANSLQPTDCGFPMVDYEIKFVHQLQNFYYFLTGAELETVQ
jgi:hypothetical protein